jgi:hypothetical protein
VKGCSTEQLEIRYDDLSQQISKKLGFISNKQISSNKLNNLSDDISRQYQIENKNAKTTLKVGLESVYEKHIQSIQKLDESVDSDQWYQEHCRS